MRLDNRRESTNIEDRRGMGGGGGMFNAGGGNNLLMLLLGMLLSNGLKGGGANGGRGKGGCAKSGCLALLIILALLYFLGGGSFGNLSQLGQSAGTETTEYVGSSEEEELKEIAAKVLAGTEDVWSALFAQMGKTYEPPTLLFYTGSTTSGCGSATSSVGPFYCSADQKIYIDLSFFSSMRSSLGVEAEGDLDFAYAYVIAHEVGHAVQDQLGWLSQAHQRMASLSEAEANKISVQIELQADFLAGVWAYHDNATYASLEDGDIEEAIDTAEKIGDDYLQQQAQGYTVPDAFTHGTSEQRERWLRKGLATGDISQGNTYAISYENL